jgi:hypothetical protein
VLFVPTPDPLTFHWYDGVVPPFAGVAVKVTDVPVHTGLAEGETEILTGRTGLTVIFTAAEVAGLPEGHATLEVRTQVIISWFTGT